MRNCQHPELGTTTIEGYWLCERTTVELAPGSIIWWNVFPGLDQIRSIDLKYFRNGRMLNRPENLHVRSIHRISAACVEKPVDSFLSQGKRCVKEMSRDARRGRLSLNPGNPRADKGICFAAQIDRRCGTRSQKSAFRPQLLTDAGGDASGDTDGDTPEGVAGGVREDCCDDVVHAANSIMRTISPRIYRSTCSCFIYLTPIVDRLHATRECNRRTE